MRLTFLFLFFSYTIGNPNYRNLAWLNRTAIPFRNSSASRYLNRGAELKKISLNHPCVCHIELSYPNNLTVVCKRGSAEFTDTVRQRGLDSS